MILVRLTFEDLRVVLRNLGAIVFTLGYTFLVPFCVAVIYGEEEMYFAFLYPAVLSIVIGYIAKRLFTGSGVVSTRLAMIIAALAWFIIPLIGSFPFTFYGIRLVDAYFETMSGYTTTGLTLIQDVEPLPKSLLFWRSFTPWIGGVGVITLFLAVLIQRRGTVASKFYATESSAERISPSTLRTVSYIWKIYIGLTALGIILYFMAGMNLFDAATHTFTSLATAGFSTRNANIGAYNSLPIEAISIFLMLVGGTSFLMIYKFAKGGKREVFDNPEIRAYLIFMMVSTVVISVNLFINGYRGTDAVRSALFHSVSAGTTTGFSTSDLAAWPDFSKAILVFLMISGGMIGSTAGGLKVLRSMILVKLSYYSVLRNLIPEGAIVTFKFRDKVVEYDEVLRVASFFFLYTSLVFVSSLLLTIFGYDFFGGVFTAASAQGTVGLTSVPTAVWYSMPVPAKIILIVNMWIGRLEIFPALALMGSIIESFRRSKPST